MKFFVKIQIRLSGYQNKTVMSAEQLLLSDLFFKLSLSLQITGVICKLEFAENRFLGSKNNNGRLFLVIYIIQSVLKFRLQAIS